MTKQTIEVDVPNGYEISKIEYFSDSQYIKVRIKEKIKPRRVMLEETEEKNLAYNKAVNTTFAAVNGEYIWRKLKETNIPLTKVDANVKRGVSQSDGEETMNLTKKDMIDLIEHIKLGGQLNPKIAEFIGDDS